MEKIEIDYQGTTLSLETGRMAKQADGSVVVSYGDTMVLVTAVAEKEYSMDKPFFPLTCVYQVKTYSQGRINGGFIKREAKPSELETLNSRLIDRPIRPLFPSNYLAETQVVATVISYDHSASPESAAMLGASAALYISDIPFVTPIAGVTVGRVDGEFIADPSPEQLAESEMKLFLAGSADAIMMVESEASQVSEDIMIEALEFGHQAIQPLIKLQEDLRAKVGKAKREVPEVEVNEELVKKVTDFAEGKLADALSIKTKMERYAAVDVVKKETVEEFITEDSEYSKGEVKSILGDIKSRLMRDAIVNEGVRVDGRGLDEVRPITCELGILPRAHGSALFTRGETQALVVTTLGTKDDEQMVDDPTGLHYKKFYLHYNFPNFSVGEVGRMGPPGRREIGHGKLAERGLSNVLPDHKTFPYTIRMVSEILESNGSSSMASVCGGSLAMMDAGVPVAKSTAGIAMGLVADGDKTAILTDILGDEDHVGDMDFKVVGTRDGITALQMDIKISGLAKETMKDALEKAKAGRLHILDIMEEAISETRESISSNAPRFIQIKVPNNKIRDIIGPGGKVIKGITAETGAKIEVDDSGMVNISSSEQSSAEAALAIIRDLVKEAEVGMVYEGTIKKIVDFGCFVEIFAGTEGLVHISELSNERIEDINKLYNEGQSLTVKAIGFDKRGKLKLSAKNID